MLKKEIVSLIKVFVAVQLVMNSPIRSLNAARKAVTKNWRSKEKPSKKEWVEKAWCLILKKAITAFNKERS